ncbi:hypothetical protein GM30_07940 [Trabulsiella odontotermitis]|nr:hypothetical protein GM30_07940 [Trabulsiella odontotermitis]
MFSGCAALTGKDETANCSSEKRALFLKKMGIKDLIVITRLARMATWKASFVYSLAGIFN